MKNTVEKNTRIRFAKPRLLILGCGDVGMRLLPLLKDQFRVFAVTSQPSRHAELRAVGAIPLTADLDQVHTLRRLAGLASHIIHLAPPRSEGTYDQRTRNLIAILPDKSSLVYVSTTGVYGDCSGVVFDETRPLHPQNARALRRVDAENQLRQWARRSQSRLSILRVPGIYAADRLPLERLNKGTPALIDRDDVYTNHIHAEDLAYLIRLALFRGSANRVYHTVDDSDMKMAAYFDLVADVFELARPPRLARSELAQQVSPVLLSFMSESRRLLNQRMKSELGARLTYPNVQYGVAAAKSQLLAEVTIGKSR
ncbi:NAD-dependent epimerase/dehydratase family protein [Undibacterium sp. Xuan67W]|uniref:NAD-dependent epimerase/dehydratase family protein n=1 Tax=Undibacterium sp. Xuan67W TaxID=3413057 RepID=UPI003BF2A053